MEIRCHGCMQIKENSPICEHCGYDERSQNNSHQLPAGTVVGRQYTLGKVLGQGGFGITYIGWDNILNQRVAVKEYFPSGYAGRDVWHTLNVTSYDNQDAHAFEANKRRFLREAESLAKLWNIPQIVKVLRHFEENGTAYIAMEFAEGEDLRRYLQRLGRPMTVEEVMQTLGPIMEALTHVHNADLVHRDISPDNIMVLPDGSAKLLDFGAARYVENADAAKDRNTSTQAILKHGFAPPEQYRSHGALGPWTDVYAMCATIYYCMTGTRPTEAMNRMIDDTEVGWEQVPGLSEKQRSVLNTGMELKPKNRLKSVAELYQGVFGEIIAAREEEKRREAERIAREEAEKRRREEAARKAAEAEKARQLRMEEQRRKEQARKEAADSKKQKRQEARKKKSGAGKWLIAVAAVLAVVIGIGMSLNQPSKSDNNPDVSMQSTTDQMIPETEFDWKHNVLVKPEQKGQTVALLKKTEAFGTGITYDQIRTITFRDMSPANMPPDAVDASADGNGGVKAWIRENGDGFNLFLAAEGGVYAPEDSSFLFAYMTDLKAIYGTLHTEYVISMEGMFSACGRLSELNLESWDTKNSNKMNAMFSSCQSLTRLNILSWDTGNVTDMHSMFSGCSGLTELKIGTWNTTNVRDMHSMFSGCSSLSELKIGKWNTANVTDMSSMFFGCSGLSELDLNKWDTENVVNMNSMFSGCKHLIKLDVSNWTTENVTDMAFMFYSCESLSALDLHNWNTRNVRNMNSMFHCCESLIALDLKMWDIGNVVDMCSMFSLCRNLATLNVDGWDTRNVVNMGYMFSSCSSLAELNVSGWDTINVTYMDHMFSSCRSLAELDVSGWATRNVTNMDFMFDGCESLSSLGKNGLHANRGTSTFLTFNRCDALPQHYKQVIYY